MRKEFIIATKVRGTETYSTIYAFNIYDESIDLQEAVKKAAAAYINTDAGYKVYQHNCQCFNWGDFFLYVPNSFLKLFGFEKEFSDITQADVNFDEQLASEQDLIFSDEKWAILKKELFMNGTESLTDFIGDKVPDDNDTVDNLLDQIAEQMPDEELYKFYEKYCLEQQLASKWKTQQLIRRINDVAALIPSSEELELDHFDGIEINGENVSGWFALSCNGSCTHTINEFLKPIITDDEIEKYDIDVRKIFDDLHVVYCG